MRNKKKDLGMSADQLAELRAAWRSLCDRNFLRYGDSGSCVMGACLRAANHAKLLSTWDACQAQGSLTWETGLSKMLAEFNGKHGTSVWYDCGYMD